MQILKENILFIVWAKIAGKTTKNKGGRYARFRFRLDERNNR